METNNALTPAVIFITGTSGAGKSTLKTRLEQLNSELIRTYDFDEVGVPEGADEQWRKRTTIHWLNVAMDNHQQGMTTVIFGQSVPSEIEVYSSEIGANISEIEAYSSEIQADIAKMRRAYGFIDITESQIRQRLLDREWPEEMIEANVNWARYLKADTMKQADYTVLDASGLTEVEVAEYFRAWIKGETYERDQKI